jgi:hypothetical protein
MTQAFNLAQLANNLNTSGQLDATDGLSGVLPVSNGGTGQSSLTANNVLIGNGTSGITSVAPGTSGNVLTSNGTSWSSQAGAGIGVGQTWQNVLASRAQNVTYTNSTGKPIQVCAAGDGNVFGDVNIQLYINGLLTDVSMASEGSSGGGVGNVSGIVPNGSTYLVNFNGGSPSLILWTELR